MPKYDASCCKCGHDHEYIETMARCRIVPSCPICGGKSEKVIVNSPVTYGDLNDFGTENGGKGRWNPQLKKYVTSVKDAEAKAAKRGWEVYGK